MNAVKIIEFFIVALFLSSCGVPKTDYEKLQHENEALKSEIQTLRNDLDEYINGAARTSALIKKAFEESNFTDAKEKLALLEKYHPEEMEKPEIIRISRQIDAKEKEEALRKEAEEKERIRLENLNNTGIWQVTHYVDNFGEPTKDGYIRNTNLISGTFSNTATQNSPLDVRFLINSSSDIDIMLFEYAGNNPVKAYSKETYSVQIQDKDGKRNSLSATNYSDRLSFGESASRIIHNALMKGGSLKFRIIEDDTPTTQYQFDIVNADWYENAYRILTGK
ncbi:hypothetical protein [Treponema brennaborense]|uniref:Lipoprotein n=1 Tax=Treponema brennaborense (strain DSM 12168 / CIP 105900 / DD5/3) TaxID=906968 RepID=F4LKW2_TREBD|nr:hypothetical protein [Treponema brennaborense]AEE16559.1 hypothetical protein Trebr_1128 [Treponema brennaborense DSM 12168]